MASPTVRLHQQRNQETTMQSTTTYTKRVNARRAGIKAGLATEEIGITVHKSKDGVRFGWKKRDQSAEPPMPVRTTVAKPERETRNGVKRPLPGTKCGAVWDWMDANPKATSKEVRDWAERTGANVNNALIESASWRRFRGLTQPRKVKAA
jgi:hypothetical protein